MLVQVNTCQQATLLEIICRGSFVSDRILAYYLKERPERM